MIGAVSKAMIAREELKRMEERPGFNSDGTPIRISKRKRVQRAADKVVGGVLGNTVGRIGRFASRRILGRIPEEALTGSYQEAKPLEVPIPSKPISSSADEVFQTNNSMVSDSESFHVSEDDKMQLVDEISQKINEQISQDITEIDSSNMKSDAELIEEAMNVKEEMKEKTSV